MIKSIDSTAPSTSQAVYCLNMNIHRSAFPVHNMRTCCCLQVSPLIDENTRKKFLVYAGNDYQAAGGLLDYINKEIIPDFLGGDCMVRCSAGCVLICNPTSVSACVFTCQNMYFCVRCPLQCDIPDGGLVQKSMYRTAEELESEEHRLLTDSIYKSASIFKGASYEVQSVLLSQHPDLHV